MLKGGLLPSLAFGGKSERELPQRLLTMAKKLEGVNELGITRFARKAQRAVGLEGAVNILLTSDEEMRRLNRRFRKKDKATDVLSFPALEGVGAAGDIAISLDIAQVNAAALGHTLRQEIKILVLHGLLHLAGYDHESDSGQMERKEARLRRELGLPGSLIARSKDMKDRPRPAGKKR